MSHYRTGLKRAQASYKDVTSALKSSSSDSTLNNINAKEKNDDGDDNDDILDEDDPHSFFTSYRQAVCNSCL
jgi:hypothetical protein